MACSGCCRCSRNHSAYCGCSWRRNRLRIAQDRVPAAGGFPHSDASLLTTENDTTERADQHGGSPLACPAGTSVSRTSALRARRSAPGARRLPPESRLSGHRGWGVMHLL